MQLDTRITKTPMAKPEQVCHCVPEPDPLPPLPRPERGSASDCGCTDNRLVVIAHVYLGGYSTIVTVLRRRDSCPRRRISHISSCLPIPCHAVFLGSTSIIGKSVVDMLRRCSIRWEEGDGGDMFPQSSRLLAGKADFHDPRRRRNETPGCFPLPLGYLNALTAT